MPGADLLLVLITTGVREEKVRWKILVDLRTPTLDGTDGAHSSAAKKGMLSWKRMAFNMKNDLLTTQRITGVQR